MLGGMSLVEQFQAIQEGLPADWADARLVLTLDDATKAERASAVVASFAAGRLGSQVRFTVPRGGGRLDQARRLLHQLDRERVAGKLELLTSAQLAPETTTAPRIAWPAAAEAWDAALAALPEDWSDLYVQVDLASSDFLERGALLLGPVNPARYGGEVGFRFRVARTSGYGASPQMTRRCLERLDEEGIRARVQILRALSDTEHVVTQGPVWYVDGKAV
jgi:hypothetical protein